MGTEAKARGLFLSLLVPTPPAESLREQSWAGPGPLQRSRSVPSQLCWFPSAGGPRRPWVSHVPHSYSQRDGPEDQGTRDRVKSHLPLPPAALPGLRRRRDSSARLSSKERHRTSPQSPMLPSDLPSPRLLCVRVLGGGGGDGTCGHRECVHAHFCVSKSEPPPTGF